MPSSSSGHTIISGAAYAPFGEPYAQPSGGNGELSFTGANKDTTWLQYDFPARQYDPRQSRWMSPDPGGLMAVDLTSPQSWNRYGYVANSPLSTIDPLGFRGCAVDGVEAPCSVADGLINLGAASPLPPAIKPEGFMSSQNGTNVPYIVTNTSEGLGFKYFGCNAKAVGLKYCNNEGFAEVLGLPTFIPSETWLWNHERDGGPLAAYLRSHAGDFVVNHIGGQKDRVFTESQAVNLCLLAVQARNNGLGPIAMPSGDPLVSLDQGTSLYGHGHILNPSGSAVGTEVQAGANLATGALSRRSDFVACMDAYYQSAK